MTTEEILKTEYSGAVETVGFGINQVNGQEVWNAKSSFLGF